MEYSVIVPVFNEEKSIPLFFNSINNVMKKLNKSYEIIFVDDGSTDNSLKELSQLSSQNYKAFSLTTHMGKSAALQTGFDNASGKIIITLDGDLQDDPGCIPALLKKLNDGYDVVTGWRYKRQDALNKIIASKVANIFRKIVFKEKINDVGCAFRAMKSYVIKDIYLSEGLHRFFTLIVKKLGYKIGEVKVNHRPRVFGKSKYKNSERLIESIIDLIKLHKGDLRTLLKPPKNKYPYKIINNYEVKYK